MGDLLDDFIAISKSIDSVKQQLGGVTDELMGKDPVEDSWDPIAYREEPSTHAQNCVACIDESASCRNCVEICPTDSIRIEDGGIEILKDCRRCGLCVGVCPTAGLTLTRYQPVDLYQRIGAIAASGEAAYVSCPRAFKKKPDEGIVIVPCVGLIPPEVWASVLLDYPNVSVYLPLGICDDCNNVTGEDAYVEAIGTGEAWSGVNLGYEVDHADLKLDKKRSVERREFVDKFMKNAGMTAAKTNPLTSGLARAYEKLDGHRAALSNIGMVLDRIEGKTEIRRILTGKRRLLLVGLKNNPDRAHHVHVKLPAWDAGLCTAGDGCRVCEELCPLNAISIEKSAVTVSPAYCTGCALCADTCPEGALSMVDTNLGVYESAIERIVRELPVSNKKK